MKLKLTIGPNSGMSTLGTYLDGLYNRYGADFLHTDPVQFAHRYTHPADQEIVAFLACLFAFGNVRSVLATVERILAPLGEHPYEMLVNTPPSPLTSLEAPSVHLSSAFGASDVRWTSSPPHAGEGQGEGDTYPTFVHRWITRADLLALLNGIHHCFAEWGSLRACFLVEYHPPKSVGPFSGKKGPTLFDVGDALSAFTRRMQAYVGVQTFGLRFLFNDPATGSACKRLNMFLRFVVRRSDGIDLGLWPAVDPAHLIMPIDTHIARISRFIGLTQRQTTNWKMAQEVTHALRQFAPDDPTKYDFGMSRIGIALGCRGYRHPKICPTCPLDPVCRAPAR